MTVDDENNIDAQLFDWMRNKRQLFACVSQVIAQNAFNMIADRYFYCRRCRIGITMNNNEIYLRHQVRSRSI
jgi:hypothetical protein